MRERKKREIGKEWQRERQIEKEPDRRIEKDRESVINLLLTVRTY